jgi:hypothetical protein
MVKGQSLEHDEKRIQTLFYLDNYVSFDKM